ncbi:MAG: hypothetical protein ACI4J9_05785 [Mogibacterium kristiansenii]|jgi:hypothetical protein|uniref:hypothetical protein n=1 Tax=Mogibacterium kristiansenii TaxID=2606708 RepID=UPI003F09396A
MAREKKEGTRVTAILDNSVHDRLLRYAEVKGQTKTMALERLLTYALNHVDDMDKEINKNI